ncbi:MAG: DUF1282 domain-containing protein [Ruminococcaceae bacterium]|nr:DUF1282 domain-containing protein [Oscillospiraceae bacterium]
MNEFKEVRKNFKTLLGHPIDTFDEMKFKRYYSWGFVIALMIAWIIIEILSKQYTGFRFNLSRPDELNVIVIVARTLAPFFLFAISNWCVCTLMDGEGKLCEIATYMAYAFTPYVLMRLIELIVSNLIIIEEQVFLSWFVTFMTFYCVCLLYQALRVVHQYSFTKTLISMLLTIAVLAIILILVLLIYSLFNQIIIFFQTVWSEIAFRYF